MKNIISFLLIFSLLISGCSVFAQGESLQGLDFGAFLGPNLSFPNTEFEPVIPGFSDKGRSGFEGGVIVDYGLSGLLGVQSGITVSTRGLKTAETVPNPIDVSEPEITITSNQNFTSLSLPLLLRLKIGPSIAKIGAFVTVGYVPELNISYRNKFDMINVMTDDNGVMTFTITQEEETSRENIRTMTGSAQVAGGILFGSAFARLAYNFGVIDFVNISDIRAGSQKLRLQHASLTVGYFF